MLVLPRSFRIVLIAVAVSAAACLPRESTPTRKGSPGARPGGKIVVGILQPSTIDPAAASAGDASLVAGVMCDPLIQLDPVNGQMRPAIAESWQIGDAGRRFTLKIRKGVRFHNGKELTAEDIAFSLTRVALPQTASPAAELLEPIVGFDEVRGLVEAKDQRFRTQLRGVRIIERFSLEISLKRSQGDFIRVLTHPLASPVPRFAADQDVGRFERRPVCAGPYRLSTAWRPGQASIVLSRFNDYYARNEGFTRGGRGYADSIEFRILPDRSAEFDQFKAGRLEVAHVPLARLGETSGEASSLVATDSGRLEYIGLPVNRPPFDQAAVRVALSQAIDRSSIAASFNGSPAQGFLPPTLGSWSRPSACGHRTPEASNLEAARRTLDRSGVRLGGHTLKLYFNDEFSNRAFAEAVAKQWRDGLGIESELVGMAWQQFLALAEGVAGFQGPFKLSWLAQYPSADRYLHPLLSSTMIGRENFSHFADQTYERGLHRRARRGEDLEDLRLEYQRLEDMACREMPIIPVTFSRTYRLVNKSAISSAVERLTDVTTGEVLIRELFKAV